MKLVIQFDERTNRLDFQHDTNAITALGMLEVAKYAILKKGAREGGPPPLDVRKIG